MDTCMKNIIINYLRAEWLQVINVYVKTKIIFNEVKYICDNIMKNNIKIWIQMNIFFQNFIIFYLIFAKKRMT